MVKLIVVAGSSSQKLADFFEKRGTFEIVAAYDNLTNNVNQIQNKVIVADKLLYLYNEKESGMNVKGDMQILNNLLKSDSFFKPGEIIFMTTDSPVAKQATKFFVTIMEDCNKSDYSIKTVEDKMSFIAIYNLMMGTSNNLDFKNSYTTLYRVERDTEEKAEYPPQNDSDLLVEPFGMDSVITYMDKQKAVAKADTGTVYTDNADTVLANEQTVQFDTIDLSSIIDTTKYVFVSGRPKSGKSVWASQLAVSASKCNLSVCLLDFTNNADVLVLLHRSSIQVAESSFLQLIRKQSKEKSLVYSAPATKDEFDVISQFFELFMNKKDSVFDVVIIVCETNLLSELQRLVIGPVDVVLTSNSVIQDINMTCEFMPLFDTNSKCTMILNNVIALDNDFMAIEDVRAILPKTVRLVKHKHFTNFDSKGQLFATLFGE